MSPVFIYMWVCVGVFFLFETRNWFTYLRLHKIYANYYKRVIIAKLMHYMIFFAWNTQTIVYFSKWCCTICLTEMIVCKKNWSQIELSIFIWEFEKIGKYIYTVLNLRLNYLNESMGYWYRHILCVTFCFSKTEQNSDKLSTRNKIPRKTTKIEWDFGRQVHSLISFSFVHLVTLNIHIRE